MVLSDDELDRLRAACDTLMRRAMLEVLASTGCYLPDLVAIERADVDLSGCTVRVGRGRHSHLADLSPEAADAVARYLKSRLDDHNPLLFVRENRPIGPQSRTNALHHLKRVQAEAGVEGDLVKRLRMTVAFQHWRGGITSRELAQVMGIARKTAEGYGTGFRHLWRSGVRWP